MFKKLLGNLPFNPSLIGQVAFYAKRVNREASFRRAGLVVMSLALALQVFAVVSPPQPSLASSSSDLLTGGFSSRQAAVSACRQDMRDFKKILGHYGISCGAVADAKTVSIAPKDHEGKLYSMGRLAYGVAGEQPVKVPGAGTLYVRHFWSLNHAPSYKALKVKTSDNQTVYILYTSGNPVFIGVPKPAPEPAPAPPVTPQPAPAPAPTPARTTSAPCPYNPGLSATSSRCYEPCPVPGKSSLPKTSPDCYEPCPYNSDISKGSAECKPCKSAQTGDDLTACLQYKKTAANRTQRLDDANGTTAQAGDVIVYTLQTTNRGKVTVRDYVVNENISDILDYAVVVDMHGGVKDENNVVSWPKRNIAAGQSLVQTLTVKIKDPIPDTPISASDEAHYDMVMTNVYGNAVNIKLPPSLIKTTEVAVTKELPNTGPGTSLAVVASITLLMAYFFARNKLFVKELDIVRADYSANGGY